MSEKAGLMPTTINIFAAPESAFESLKKGGRAWFPVILMILFGCLSQLLYFYLLDFNWFIDYVISTLGENSTPSIEEQTRATLGGLGKNVYTIIAMVTVILGTPIFLAIFSLFYLIVSSIRNDNLSFGQCFSLVSWASLVSLVSLLIGIGLVLMGGGQVEPEQIKGLALNTLIFQVDVVHPWYAWLSNLDLTYLWTSAIVGIGYHKWTNASFTASTIVGFLPLVLIFGIWAAFI